MEQILSKFENFWGKISPVVADGTLMPHTLNRMKKWFTCWYFQNKHFDHFKMCINDKCTVKKKDEKPKEKNLSQILEITKVFKNVPSATKCPVRNILNLNLIQTQFLIITLIKCCRLLFYMSSSQKKWILLKNKQKFAMSHEFHNTGCLVRNKMSRPRHFKFY